MNKKGFKASAGKCYFCSEADLDLLDVHRIYEGADGGKYTWRNCIAVCALCHRKITVGKIKTYRKYLSSNGEWLLHWRDENGVEHYE